MPCRRSRVRAPSAAFYRATRPFKGIVSACDTTLLWSEVAQRAASSPRGCRRISSGRSAWSRLGPTTARAAPVAGRRLLDPRGLTFTHDWGIGGEDERSLGARVIGGCSTHNACMAVAGTPRDYDEWGEAWAWAASRRTFHARVRCSKSARRTRGTRHRCISRFSKRQRVWVAVPRRCRRPMATPGAARIPVNVVDAARWNAAFAYLDPARGRGNLTILADTLVDRIVLDWRPRHRAITAAGEQIEADVVVLTAGAYLTPAILLRSGIGPESELVRIGSRRRRVAGRRGAARPPRHRDQLGAERDAQPGDRRPRSSHRTAVCASRGREGGKQRLRRGQLGPPPRSVDERCEAATATRRASASST